MKCRGNRLGRRGFVAGGLAGGLGIGLADLLFLQSSSAGEVALKSGPPASSVIHIYLPGGVPHQETWDPKPFAPMEYRGDFGSVKTKTGEYFSSGLRQLAGVADKMTVIRSMTHTDAAHERGTEHMFTGYPPSPAIRYPSWGSIVSHELGSRHELPPYVCIPKMPSEFAGSGYLSSAFAPFSLGGDPARGDFKVRDLDLPQGVSPERFAKRRETLAEINAGFDAAANSDNVAAMDAFYQRAFDLLGSESARAAFNIREETKEVRDRYGMTDAGQRMLMARRLVEAGVRLVTLTYGAWDLHARVSDGVRRMLPSFDKALAALINDLDSSGRLSETLVVVTSEFGRTPKINKDAGRDHWPRVFSVMLAGGGVQRGLIHGASNATAAEPDLDPVSPADLSATIFHQLGIDYEKELLSDGNRPVEIVKGGRVLTEIIT